MSIKIRTLHVVAAVIAVFALPSLAPAAVRTWSSMVTTPNSTNVTAGVATNVSASISIQNGSGASTRFVGPALLTATVSPSDPSISVSLSQTNFTFPNANSNAVSTLSVSTTALTPSNTYVVSIVINTNGAPNVNVAPVTNTYTITMVSGGPFNPAMVWAPAGVNGNWSTPNNWSPTGPPTSVNDVQFFDGGAVGTTNTVDNTADTTSIIGSLTYGPTNNGNYHTTLIASGKSLTITGTNGLSVGTGTDPGDGELPTAAITGVGASLTLSNASALVNVNQSHTTVNNAISQAQAVLDLSGLDNFNASVARLLIGTDVSIKGGSGALNLARTNSFAATTGSTAPQINIGDNSQASGSPAIPSILRLGQSNAFNADSISVGRGKTDGTGASILFNGAFASPSASFRGTGGNSSRVSSWTIGDGFGSRTFFCFGICDFSLGSVNALVDTMVVGRGANVAIANGANDPGTGTLNLGAGTIDVNMLQVGVSISATGTGTVNVSGGSLLVNTSLQLASGAGSQATLNVTGGTVSANSGILAGGGTANISIAGGALNVTNSTATIGSSAQPLTALTLNGSSITIAAQSLSPSVFAGNLNITGGANVISITAIPLISSFPARFPLIQYFGLNGDPTLLTLGSLPPASQTYAGFLTNNTANSSIDFVVTSGPQFFPLVWDGAASGDWDTATLNWKTNGVLTKYSQGYPQVRFDDTLTGTSNVNLTTALTPGAVAVVNSAEDYTFSGAGKISGSAGLTKDGSRTLVLTESGGDDFTGGVTVLGGTLQIGNGGTSGTLPPGTANIGASGALVFDRSDNVSLATVLSGLGTVTQEGGSILALNGSNSAFGGQIIVNEGTVQAGNVAALGAATASVNIGNGATLDVNGQKFNNTESITATGAGINSLGAIVNNSTNSTTQVLRNVTLGGNTTFGGTADWDIHASANAATDASLNTGGNAWDISKVGTNTVTFFGVMIDGSLGDINVHAGTVSVERNTSGIGDPNHTITVFSNASFQIANASNVWTKLVTLNDGGTFRGVNSNEFAGAVTLQSGVGTLLAGSSGLLKLDAAVGGAGGLTKSGVGAVYLTSASAYTGPTVVSQGNLFLINSGSIDSSTNITVSSGAVLDLSQLATPTLTMTSSRTLQGSGTIVGSVTMGTGSTLTVGSPGTNSIGALTITNTLQLQAGSTSIFEVGKVGTNAVSDEVICTNANYSGTLTVLGAGGAFAPGDIFALFSAGSYSGSFSAFNLPVGVTWDTSQLGVNGTIKVLTVSKPAFSSIVPTNGAFSLSFTGPAGNSYRVWANTNAIARPIAATWSVVASNQFNALGMAAFQDTNAASFSERFYLISVP